MEHRAGSRKIQDVIAAINGSIADGRYHRGSALPPMRQLAGELGVSYVTLWKAVRMMQKQGVLSSTPRQATMVVDPSAKPESFSSINPAESKKEAVSAPHGVRRIKELIERDIAEGAYERGSKLPLVKQFKSRYGAAYRTISEALRQLHHEGLIKPYGKGYEVPRLSCLDTKAAICLCADRKYIDQYVTGFISGHDYLHLMELQGSRQFVKILFGGCTYADGRAVPENPATLFPAPSKSGGAILGYVYKMNTPGEENETMFSLFRQQRAPVSILDEQGGVDYRKLLGGSPLFRIFPVGTSLLPGKIMGRYLLGLGHRSIAYISPYEKASWSIMRLAGLREVFERAGNGGGIKECIAYIEPGGEEGHTIAAGGIRSRKPDREQVLREQFDYNKKIFRRHCANMFSRALSDKSITAWVAANDWVALKAIEFLRKKHIRMPEQISLVSFDDSQSAIAYKLTSYNLNVLSIVNAALSHILDYSVRPKKKGPDCVEIEGIIVERESSGRAPDR
jgi:DNA-binding GntR family transcriptional regulator